MTEEMNQRQQTVTFPFEISHGTQTQAHYGLRGNVSILSTLIWMASDPDTHNENKRIPEAPDTGAENKRHTATPYFMSEHT